MPSATRANAAKAFDYAVVGGQRLTEAEFLRLPLKQRVRALLQGEIEFYDGDDRLAPREALGRLLQR